VARTCRGLHHLLPELALARLLGLLAPIAADLDDPLEPAPGILVLNSSALFSSFSSSELVAAEALSASAGVL
jgi:hypothetical protein